MIKPNDEVTITMTAAQAAVVGMLIGKTSEYERIAEVMGNGDYSQEDKDFAKEGCELTLLYERLCDIFEGSGLFLQSVGWGEVLL